MGNQWFTEEGVLRSIQLNYPDVKKIIDVERNIFWRSIITAESDGGKRIKFELDTNLMSNHVLNKIN
jgi:hypothetical protein